MGVDIDSMIIPVIIGLGFGLLILFTLFFLRARKLDGGVTISPKVEVPVKESKPEVKVEVKAEKEIKEVEIMPEIKVPKLDPKKPMTVYRGNTVTTIKPQPMGFPYAAGGLIGGFGLALFLIGAYGVPLIKEELVIIGATCALAGMLCFAGVYMTNRRAVNDG